MPWQKKFSALFMDALKLAARAGLSLNAIFLSVFTVWFTAKLLLKVGRWLDDALFQ